MASPKISVQDLIMSCGLEDASLLNKEVEDVEFYELSQYLTKWKLLASKLGVKADVYTIESERADMQRVKFLEMWKQRCAFKATYRVLVDALLSINQADNARGVCQILRGK